MYRYRYQYKGIGRTLYERQNRNPVTGIHLPKRNPDDGQVPLIEQVERPMIPSQVVTGTQSILTPKSHLNMTTTNENSKHTNEDQTITVTNDPNNGCIPEQVFNPSVLLTARKTDDTQFNFGPEFTPEVESNQSVLVSESRLRLFLCWSQS